MTPSRMNLWLIVPVKPFHEAKSRLTGALSTEERTLLSARLLEHTLLVAAAAQSFARTVVVSRDPAALSMAARSNALPLKEKGGELNAALTQACHFAAASGAEAALLLPSDLPKLQPDDLRWLAEQFRLHPASVVIVPSRDGGTNALVTPLPLPFTLAFGARSSQAHQRRALAAGCVVYIVHRPALGFDLDTPGDLSEWLHAPSERIKSP
ncbi:MULTISPECIES: 2-phospho-L-lactate guanylyltransferase [Caldilinea]|nr:MULTISPECIES: 2-phospho-L-lactate guanylyltransferase [Caldilinea]MBO9394097.1 2-phospho-L-lactate guanylyltransferase [Caldilinea sp.]